MYGIQEPDEAIDEDDGKGKDGYAVRASVRKDEIHLRIQREAGAEPGDNREPVYDVMVDERFWWHVFIVLLPEPHVGDVNAENDDDREQGRQIRQEYFAPVRAYRHSERQDRYLKQSHLPPREFPFAEDVHTGVR